MPPRVRLGNRVLLAAVLLGVVAPPAWPQAVYEFSEVASSSADSPSVDLEDPLNAHVCVEFGRGLAVSEVAERLHVSPSALQIRVDAMARAGLLRPDKPGSYMPTFPTIRRADVAWFQQIDRPLVDRVVRLVKGRKEELQTRFLDMLHLDPAQGRSLSLLLFGDVLFDRWQVRNVRKSFLPGYPPPRDGKLFYLVASEDATGRRASLGFYSHTEERHDGILVVTFGNGRSLDPFPAQDPERATHLLDSYLAFGRGTSPAPPELEHLGFVQSGKSAVSVVPRSAYTRLPDITNDFTDELLRALNDDRPKIHAAYEASRYGREVAFQEFALWWYHFFYADVIDQLTKDGIITVPAVGHATLIVSPD